MLNISNSTEVTLTSSPCSSFLDEFSIMKKFIYHIWICIAIFGLAANIINIIVFLKVDSKDNVTITLLTLSISDLINLSIISLRIVGQFISANYPHHIWPFDFYILVLGPYWYAYVFYDYSSFISVFLATVRCACVASPLRFKAMFTKARTVKILCVLFMFALVLRIPVLTVFSLTWAVNPLTNSTYRSIKFSANYREIYAANDVLNRNIITWVTYVTVVTCVVVLATKLQAASRFRHSLANAGTGNSQMDKMAADMKGTPKPCAISDDRQYVAKSKNISEKMSTKDLQVIQSVTLICVIFILSQLPYQIVSTVRLFMPEFGNFRSGLCLYGFVSHISSTCALLNASVNIFIHARFNSRYRQIFLGLFSK